MLACIAHRLTPAIWQQVSRVAWVTGLGKFSCKNMHNLKGKYGNTIYIFLLEFFKTSAHQLRTGATDKYYQFS